MQHEKHIKHCFQLAEKGLGQVSPNPMVGCVLVVNDTIIGEGFHQMYGEAHAEVNAIKSVKDSSLITKATLYVNLEPCSHQGKTPPCADFIIQQGIKKVVISNTDSNPLVAGKGIAKLKEAGIEVITGVLEEEGKNLNKRFFTFHEKKRPYIILKWAQTQDGYISRFPIPDDLKENWITGEECKKRSHLWRSQEDAIMIGTNTALNDDPQLTTRLVKGKNPIRVVIDKKLMIPQTANIFNEEAKTIVFTEEEKTGNNHVEYIKTNFEENRIRFILSELHQRNISSLIVEGGAILINSFIQQNLWDEARILVSDKKFGHGISAPSFQIPSSDCISLENDKIFMITNKLSKIALS